MRFLSSLTRDQKQAVGLLQIGTFLEYFDLMLYVHMAVLLNELFFPKTDPHTAALLAALSFCSTYVLRPFGALLFGYIGDVKGRKTTVIITTTMMAISCSVMAMLPTYAQIGIASAWIVTICRIVQGLSSMGEIIGAEIYVTEITKTPVRYPLVGLIGTASKIGTMVALGIATLATSYDFNWRYAFWVGAAIAIIGSYARTRLQETPAFTEMQEQRQLNKLNSTPIPQTFTTWTGNSRWKTLLALFMIECGAPVSLYFTYIHCGNILKTTFGFTAQQVISQNFMISILEFVSIFATVLLTYKIHPVKVMRARILLFIPFMLLYPFLLTNYMAISTVMLIQVVGALLPLNPIPGVAVFTVHIPIFRRFTYPCFIYALSRAFIHVIIAFGLVYLTIIPDYWGLWAILVPTVLGSLWAVNHFGRLEKIAAANQVVAQDALLKAA
jgi:MFS family permease